MIYSFIVSIHIKSLINYTNHLLFILHFEYRFHITMLICVTSFGQTQVKEFRYVHFVLE